MKSFKPAWWLPGPHLQTLWPFIFRQKINIHTRRERFELFDGDFVDLDWSVSPGSGPIVVLLHGLEGSIQSIWAGGLMRAIEAQNWRSVFMHFRSCSGEMNRHVRLYHSGDTADLAEVIASIRQREPETPLAAIGCSLGGNVLLKWLGETGRDNPFTAAAAISVPFVISQTASKINCGFSRIYQWYFLRALNKKVRSKYDHQSARWKMPDLEKIRTLRLFDEYITAPLHGFNGAEDYYEKSSSRQFLAGIQVPTLLLQAKDDPLMTPDIVPAPEELSSVIHLELTQGGGHLGFVTGKIPWSAKYWVETRVPEFLKLYLCKKILTVF